MSKKEKKGGYRQINDALNICAFEDYLDAQQTRLPEIANVEYISPRVIRVLGQNAGKFTLQGTNTYIVGTGSRRLLIDTGQGIPEWADLISATLNKHGISLSHVLLTHWHGDHTGGVPDLLRLYPELGDSIYKHSPSKTKTQKQQPIVDGQVFALEGATVRAVHAPGHSADHMCFILEEEKAMFTGDNVLGHGTAAVEQLGTWIKSLGIMRSHACVLGYPAHGVVIPDLAAKINSELLSKARREEQILQALSAMKLNDKTTTATAGGKGSATVSQLVTAMHGNVDVDIRKMAIEPFTEEMLRKLAEDSKVAFEVRRGEKRWFTIQLESGSAL